MSGEMLILLTILNVAIFGLNVGFSLALSRLSKGRLELAQRLSDHADVILKNADRSLKAWDGLLKHGDQLLGVPAR